MTDKNPFAQVYSELWCMLLQHPGFVNDVREGNRIRLDGLKDRGPIKPSVADADLPEVMLISNSASPRLFSTSSSSSCVRTYTWMVSTGDFRYYVDEETPLLATIEWYIFVAMHAWKERLGALTHAD